MTNEFKTALQDFAFEAAAGRAIRHLCDLGLSAEEIRKELDYPVGIDRIQKEMEAYLREKQRIQDGEEEGYTYIKEYDAFGKASFRRVKQES